LPYFAEVNDIQNNVLLPFSKISNYQIDFADTVKPVYNGHPWDLKNMAVMQRIVSKRSVVSRIQPGRYGFRLAVVDRWPIFRGGR
jgi:hypothetical protein